MKAPLGFGLGVLVVVLSAHSAAGQAPAPFRDSGSALFETYCASCHGYDAHGDGPVAESLKTRPPNLTQLAKLNGGTFPAERTRRVIDGREARVRAHGSIEMPRPGHASTPSSAIWTPFRNGQPIEKGSVSDGDHESGCLPG